MEIPKRLYKYESFNEFSLRNLKKQCLYFANPSSFNDPYDCAILAELSDLTVEQIEDFKNSYINNEKTPDHVKNYMKISTNQFIGDNLKSTISDELNKIRERVYPSIGITCFSESNSDLLMWSHYGGKYKGFCLEFDSECELFAKARKVKYSDEMPKFDPMSFLKSGTDNEFMNLFSIKSKSWEYEKEWRVFNLQSGMQSPYPEQALTGIYFGPDIESECLEIVALIVSNQNRHVKLFKGKRSTSVFKVEFEEVEYTPHVIAQKLGLK